MSQTPFNTIGLIIRQDTEQHLQAIHSICLALDAYGKILLHYLDDKATFTDCSSVSIDELIEGSDLVISVGGDGTLLTAARCIVDKGIPLIGINLGRLGFLADVTMTDLEKNLQAICSGNYRKEQRFFLQGQLGTNKKVQKKGIIALNDIILHTHKSISMIEFEVFSDGQLINRQRADGLIVSTPTGSTAYSLSGGGPIMHPTLNAIALVPICPHMLSNRPIVLPSDQEIEIRLSQPNMSAEVTFDGQDSIIIGENESIFINRYQKQITLLHPNDYDYFHILREKLKWSNSP